MIKAIARFLSVRRASTPPANASRLEAWEAEGGALQPEGSGRTAKRDVETGEPAITMERLLDELGTVADATAQNLGAAAERLMRRREKAIQHTAALRAADHSVRQRTDPGANPP